MMASVLNCVKKICAAVLGRLQVGRGQLHMELVETLNLGGKRQLMLVECDGQRYLIGVGGDGVHSIHSVSKTDMAIAHAIGADTTCEDAAMNSCAGCIH